MRTATEVGGKSVEELAAEVMGSIEDRVIEISGAGYQALESLTRYDNRDTIAAKGDRWFETNKDHLEKVTLGDILVKKQKTIDKYLAEREVQQNWELFRTLVARGVDQSSAMTSAFPNGIPAPKK